MDDEEEIPVKYRLRGETEWHLKKEAIMNLGKTQWGIRLKLCKQGDGHNYYSLHVAFMTKGSVARAQIKCHREGEEKVDWLQEYTFGGVQNLLINPCLMKIENREKVTFVVEIKLLWSSEKEFELPSTIAFPNADFALKIDDKKLMIDQGYIKRRAPLLGYLFDCEEGGAEEKKEHDLSDRDIDFQDLVDCFGCFQHQWPLSAPRLLELIPIARALGFDIWGKALNREFSQLVYRHEPVKIEPVGKERPQALDFDEPVLWTINDVSKLESSTVNSNQHVVLSSMDNRRNCIVYAYTQEYFGSKYLSLGFQMVKSSTPLVFDTTPSASTAPEEAVASEEATGSEDVPASEDVEETVEETIEDVAEDMFPEVFDIGICIRTADGAFVCYDKIRRVRDDDYIIVGSPVFQRLENIRRYLTEDDKLTVEITWKESADDQNDDTYTLPGVTDCNIICEHVVMKVNKEYLAHHSEYFRALLFGRFIEAQQSSIDLGAEEFSTFKAALEMIYNRRVTISEKNIDDYLYFARRLLFNSITEGIAFQLWSSSMDVTDKKWLAQEYMLTNLEVKCQMDLKEEQLRQQRASRKRARPADFQDEPPAAPLQPVPAEMLQFPEFPIPEQLSS